MGDIVFRALVMGIGATALLDLWALLLNRVFGFAMPNWALVGRWFCHLPAGRFVHADIGRAEPFRHELSAGWIGHYAIGILFAAGTLAIGGAAWAKAPSLALPLVVGWVTVGCGWFILQPGMGAGIAASKRPNPGQVRVLNLLGHTVFGLGLYATALLIR